MTMSQGPEVEPLPESPPESLSRDLLTFGCHLEPLAEGWGHTGSKLVEGDHSKSTRSSERVYLRSKVHFEEDFGYSTLMSKVHFEEDAGYSKPKGARLDEGYCPKSTRSGEGVYSRSKVHFEEDAGYLKLKGARLDEGYCPKSTRSGEGVYSRSKVHLEEDAGYSKPKGARLDEGYCPKSTQSGEGVYSRSKVHLEEDAGYSKPKGARLDEGYCPKSTRSREGVYSRSKVHFEEDASYSKPKGARLDEGGLNSTISLCHHQPTGSPAHTWCDEQHRRSARRGLGHAGGTSKGGWSLPSLRAVTKGLERRALTAPRCPKFPALRDAGTVAGNFEGMSLLKKGKELVKGVEIISWLLELRVLLDDQAYESIPFTTARLDEVQPKLR
ncbi:hypothetical protein BKA82DRAFT_4017376 [Pisolithus tinctorius]|nr:hypothetical protein BKA82DRAFT_4017376 [Pisolithus tinctorius]